MWIKSKMSLFTTDYWYDQHYIKNIFNIFCPAKYTTGFLFSLFMSLLSHIIFQIKNKPSHTSPEYQFSEKQMWVVAFHHPFQILHFSIC